jgi:hypothetical protein
MKWSLFIHSCVTNGVSYSLVVDTCVCVCVCVCVCAMWALFTNLHKRDNAYMRERESVRMHERGDVHTNCTIVHVDDVGENLGFNYQLSYHKPCNIHQFSHWKPIW